MKKDSLEITKEILRRHVEAFLADPHRSSMANVVLSLVDYKELYWNRQREREGR